MDFLFALFSWIRARSSNDNIKLKDHFRQHLSNKNILKSIYIKFFSTIFSLMTKHPYPHHLLGEEQVTSEFLVANSAPLSLSRSKTQIRGS